MCSLPVGWPSKAVTSWQSGSTQRATTATYRRRLKAVDVRDGGPSPATTDLAECRRRDFPDPCESQEWADVTPLVYLDRANSSQKPRVVVEAIEDHYLNHNANVARAMHVLGAEATEAFEDSRAQLARFIGANRAEEVVFTKNASEALNLCAYTLGTSLRPGDEIVISVMEHHSNIVPWQLLAQRSGRCCAGST